MHPRMSNTNREGSDLLCSIFIDNYTYIILRSIVIVLIITSSQECFGLRGDIENHTPSRKGKGPDHPISKPEIYIFA